MVFIIFFTGNVAWDFEQEVEPIGMDCTVIDTNKDGLLDCLIVDSKVFMLYNKFEKSTILIYRG